MKNNGRHLLFILVLVAMTTACKYFFGQDADWSGFSPVIAIALFSGFVMKQKGMSFLLPLVALLLSDFAIQALYMIGEFSYPGIYSGQWKNYLLLMTATLVGWLLKGKSYSSLLVGAIAAPTVFFLLSNFNVWVSMGEAAYSRDFSGLMSSYIAGLPFYKNGLIATLIFLPCIVLIYNFILRRKTILTMA
jgi:hypothetical protein